MVLGVTSFIAIDEIDEMYTCLVGLLWAGDKICNIMKQFNTLQQKNMKKLLSCPKMSRLTTLHLAEEGGGGSCMHDFTYMCGCWGSVF